MYRTLLVAATIIFISQTAQANQQELWHCVDNSTLSADQQCLAKIMAKHIDNQQFFAELAHKNFSPSYDAFSTVTYYPNKQLIEVKSIEDAPQDKLLIVSKR